MSHTVTIPVTTEPMAQEISGVSKRVTGTTAAVVAMQTAVVSAERQASNKICQNVNKGFYSLIHSQISQKIAKEQSEVDSLLMQMSTQTRQLLEIKGRMEKDYRRISATYQKLFSSLNQSLKNRVFELDKPVVDFSVKEVGKISNRPLNLVSTAPFMQLEALTESQKIISANVKKRSAAMLEFIKRFLMNSKHQKKVTESILYKKAMEIDVSAINVPTVICESIIDASENKNIKISLPQEVLSGYTKSEIKNAVYSNISYIKWEKGQANDIIKSEFSRLNGSSSNSERIKKLAMELFNKNEFQVTAGIEQ
jgi:hypothetical protein